MKKSFPIFVFGALFCVSSFCFLKYDSERFDYGWNCNFCNKKLPYSLEHKFYDEDRKRFYLLDADGLELVGSGFKFYSNSFTIKDFLGYGYNDTSIIVKCADSLNIVKYLTSYQTKYKSKNGNPDISFKDLSNYGFEKVKDNYNWIVFNHEEAQNATFNRFLSMLGVLISLFFIIRQFLKLRKTKAIV
jgi:hypothetical protein